MYTAVIRRVHGLRVKTAKRCGTDLFFEDTKLANISTFFQAWPKGLSNFMMYGRSARAELKYPTFRTGGFLTHASRRCYGTVAMEVEEANLADAGALDDRSTSGGAGAPLSNSAEAMEPPPAAPPPPAAGAAAPAQKMTLHRLNCKYNKSQPISMVTAYDYPSARLADSAGVDALLVGDSLGMVVLGRDDTTDVTMEEMVHHCRAAARGTERAFLIGDLPFGSCLSPLDAARNGVRLVKEGRVDAVKIEGGTRMLKQVKSLVDAGVAVMGHIGLTPQSYAALGGWRVQGRTAADASSLLHEARQLEEAGCFAIVLEMVPAEVAEAITQRLTIPTVGIGAGCGTSGQVQVFHDLLGLYDKIAPKFSMQFGSFEAPMTDALQRYSKAVGQRAFPQPRHTFKMAHSELDAFKTSLDADDESTPTTASSSSAAAAPVVTTTTTATANTGGGASAAARLLVSGAADVRSSPIVVRTISEWRNLEKAGTLRPQTIGLVPTMGALHEGHLSLVRRAALENEVSAASIFVNPKQFAAHEDLDTYPRQLEADLTKLSECGVDYVFAPSAEEMYPKSTPSRLSPYIDLNEVDETTAEGAARPQFFRGVCTVVAKLLNITKPRVAYFGQKDGMQCIAIKRLIEDLNFDTRLIIGETVREPDGLAMSSRNAYLNEAERAAAPAVYQSLGALRTLYEGGERSPAALVAEVATAIQQAAAAAQQEEEAKAATTMTLEYLNLASALDGRDLGGAASLPPREPTLASIAVKLGSTRLIDNIVLGKQ